MSDEKVSLIKEASDIVDVVGSYISLKPVGATFKGLCPFHDDHRPSFDVDPRRGRYRCWSCGKYGDVISFVQEFEKVEFTEALDILARRAGITIEKCKNFLQNQTRGSMLDSVRWAAEQYHQCLQESTLATEARNYLSGRGLEDEIIRQFGLGYAPRRGDWLVELAQSRGVDLNMLEQVGLIARRNEGPGFYDRFRDRVMFPIRNVMGNPVGFGGRILPGSPLAERAAKYYNSSDSPLFTKSEQLYGIDQARHVCAKVGYLAVVEGYTDVMMAHQMGIHQVVATMGTAINGRHLRQLRRWTNRVVLVFDADEGGDQGVDRALELFATHDMDLAVATLPGGLDPCDLLMRGGPEPFQKILDSAVEALEFKMSRLLPVTPGVEPAVEVSRRAMDVLLGILAKVPIDNNPSSALKVQLMMGRIARRLGVLETTLWQRMKEMKTSQPVERRENTPEPPKAKAAPEEIELVEVLLSAPFLVARACQEISLDTLEHPGLRKICAILFEIQAEGKTPDVDEVRVRLGDSPVATRVLDLADHGRRNNEPEAWYAQVVAFFQERIKKPQLRDLKEKLQVTADHENALELLKKLQTCSVNQTAGTVAVTVPANSPGDGGF